MNILYIGPYRLNNSLGYESLNFLLELQDQHTNMVSKPIYYQQPISKLDDIENLLSKLENKQIKEFDLVVQHSTPESMVYNSKIKKHIFIPILQNKLNNIYQKQICNFLQTKGSFIVNNDIDDYILIESKINNKHLIKTTINYRLSKISHGTFNLGLYNAYKKYYTITNSSNIKNIKNLIINFIKNNNENSSCLVIFMQEVAQSTLEKYNSFIKQIYQGFDIKHSITQILIIPIELDNYSISTIHSCGDIYIDISNDIHKYYAIQYNKPILYNTSEIILHYDSENVNSIETVGYKDLIDLNDIKPTIAPSLTLNEIIKNNV